MRTAKVFFIIPIFWLSVETSDGDDVDVSQRELLMKAFGSMNLGAQTEDAAEDQAGQNVDSDASLRNFEEFEKFERQLEAERVTVAELQATVAHKDKEIIELVAEKEQAEQEVA